MWENVKNLQNHVVGRRFHNETKPSNLEKHSTLNMIRIFIKLPSLCPCTCQESTHDLWCGNQSFLLCSVSAPLLLLVRVKIFSMHCHGLRASVFSSVGVYLSIWVKSNLPRHLKHEAKVNKILLGLACSKSKSVSDQVSMKLKALLLLLALCLGLPGLVQCQNSTEIALHFPLWIQGDSFTLNLVPIFTALKLAFILGMCTIQARLLRYILLGAYLSKSQKQFTYKIHKKLWFRCPFLKSRGTVQAERV